MVDLFHEFPFTLRGHGSHLVPIRWAAQGLRIYGVGRGIEQFYLMGVIRYHGFAYNLEDDSMDESWMGFCRKYTMPGIVGGEGDFRPVDNSNYEYSD